MALWLHIRVIFVISFVCMFHFTFCNVLCVSVLCCIIQVAMTFSVCKNIHKEVDTRILQTYQFREWCIKPNQILSRDPWCVCVAQSNYHCCSLFRSIKYGHTSPLKIWEVLKLLLKNCTLCHAMALERTFQPRCWCFEADIEGNNLICYLYDATQCIRTNVVCSASTGITELPHVTIAPFYVRRVYYQGVIWNRGMESVIDARGGVIYATGLLGRCLWNPKIRPNQVPAHTQNKDPYKYQESRCQCFACCLCTHISIHLDSTL